MIAAAGATLASSTSTSDKILMVALAVLAIVSFIVIVRVTALAAELWDERVHAALTDPAYAPYGADLDDREPTDGEAAVEALLRAHADAFVPQLGDEQRRAIRDRVTALAAGDRSDPAHPDHHSWVVTTHVPCSDPYTCTHAAAYSVAHCAYDAEAWPCAASGRLTQTDEGPQSHFDEDTRALRRNWRETGRWH
jgi:hypothetical protein